ncbi:unnamed protein product [Blepharisma stoltei]|uniref:Uncharacterized protein n=1 Tax=Blepharisma stoltei TaxID=1481888 RepID=A0AAU9JLA9_9CILI|nr:unnamed protein product [Blepharisma stoltei]
MAFYEQCPRCDYFEEIISSQSNKISSTLSMLEPLNVPGIAEETIMVPQVHSQEMIPVKLPREPTSREESDYVKSAMFALNQKLKLLKYLDHEKEQLTALYSQSIKNTKDIQLSADDTFNQLNEDIKQHEKDMVEIHEDILELQQLLKEEEEKCSRADSVIFGLLENKSDFESDIQELANKVNDAAELMKNIKNTQNALENTEKERQQVFKETNDEIARFRDENNKLTNSAKQCEEENKALRETIDKLRKELQNEKQKELQLLRRKLQLQGELERKKALKTLQIEEKEFLLNYREIGDYYKKSIKVLKQEIKNTLNIYENQRKKLSQQDENIKVSIDELHSHIAVVSNKISIQEAIIGDLSDNNGLLQSKIDLYSKKLEETISYNKDESLHEYLNQLSTKLLTLADLFLLQSYQLNIAQKSADHLRNILENTSEEIESLEKEAVDEQLRVKEYFAEDGDELDILLGEKILSLGKPLNIGIVRLEEGIYRIGDQKVKLALEGKEIQVVHENFSQSFERFLSSL